MRRGWMIAAFLIATMFIEQSADAMHLKNRAPSHKDSIEWVSFSTFPTTREAQLEYMLTLELQRKVLWALQENNYLEPGIDNPYWFDPFEVSMMRQNEHGFAEIVVTARIHDIVNQEIEKKYDSYIISFRHDYDAGFFVTGVKKQSGLESE
ncbi:hypothetical protein [Paenibacillus daejeonensis]|uniref:hypothetical protein n=1 Tax=Paenibacillus daejeonensis TaxID=135193 RepID=UPI00037F27EB|nr:hypothetical protein [Paenibacillus daejeonensis]